MDRGALADSVSELIDGIVDLDRAIGAMTAVRLRLLDQVRRHAELADEVFATADRELSRRAFRAELAAALRMPEATTDRLLSEAMILVDELPATLKAMADGRLTPRHARLLVDETRGIEPSDRAELESTAIVMADALSLRAFERRLRMLRERRAPEAAAERGRRAHERRDVTFDPAHDGMAYLTAQLSAVDAVAIRERLEEAARSARRDGDLRTIGQLRADVFRDALLLSCTSAPGDDPLAGIVPSVVVTVPAATIVGGNAPGTLEGYGPIDAATARRLASGAPTLQRLLTDPETGQGIALGRTRYRLTAELRTWLRMRDVVCRFPMCGRSARWCDVDHTLDWAYDGTTEGSNLAHLCRGHHTLKHASRWQVEQDAGGSGQLTWTSPLGRRHITAPEWSGG